MTSFREFANICSMIEQTSGSLDITSIVSDFFSKVTNYELPIITHFIRGTIFPEWSNKKIGVGNGLMLNALSQFSGLSIDLIERIVKETGDLGKTAVYIFNNMSKGQVTFSSFFDESCQLTISDVFDRLTYISHACGKGAQTVRIKNLQYLFNSASSEEIEYIVRLVIEDMRIGVGEGIVRDSIAHAFDVPVTYVERAYMLTNDLGIVALTAKEKGLDGLLQLDLKIDRPIKLMLAQVTPNIKSALSELNVAAVEWKFDGARLQIHKDGNVINLYSRRLENLTASLPDITLAVNQTVNAQTAILDGEAVAIDENGRPKPFQEILKRFRRKYDVENKIKHIPLVLNIFDIMYLNGKSLIDLPLIKRREALTNIVNNNKIVKVDKQLISSDIDEIENMYTQALKAGHEGIMIKNPNSIYSPGKRGKNWLKKKPVMETLDLVVIGAEWGYGRRTNYLGSYALACMDLKTGMYLSVGKVATGISDEQLAEFTNLFKDLIVGESGISVEINPHIIFEIAFEEIQKSINYNSGYALRFPRLVSIRYDKALDEVDTLTRIEDMYKTQRNKIL